MDISNLTEINVISGRSTRNILFYSVSNENINIAKSKGTIVTIPTTLVTFISTALIFLEEDYIKGKKVLLSEEFVNEVSSSYGILATALTSEKYKYSVLSFKTNTSVDAAYISFDTKSEAAKFKLEL